MPEDARIPQTDWKHSQATGVAKTVPRRNLEQVHPQRESFWEKAKRIIGRKKLSTIAAGGTAVLMTQTPVGGAVDQGVNTLASAFNTSQAEDQIQAQQEKMAQEKQHYVFKDGQFVVDASIVNDMHIKTFGGTPVSPEFKSYKINLADLVRNADGSGWSLQILVIDENGKAEIQALACDPGAEIGGGPAGGAVIGLKGELVPMGSPDAPRITLDQLSRAIGSIEPIPVPNPAIPTAPNT